VDSRSVISRHLTPGERILWVGHPDPGRWFGPADAYLVPFSLFWLGFAIFWEVNALTRVLDAPSQQPFLLIFPDFGVPFVLIGLYFAFGRFIVKSRRRRRTEYALTDRRVIAVERRAGGEVVQATFLDQIPAVNTRTRSDGSGTITFGAPSAGWMEAYADTGMEIFAGGAVVPLAFRDIPNVAELTELVDHARDEARRPDASTRG